MYRQHIMKNTKSSVFIFPDRKQYLKKCKRVLQTKEINNFNERSNILRGKNKNKNNALLVSGIAAGLPGLHRNRNKIICSE